MKRARFVAPARGEFLAEVGYYNQVQRGQGARFATAVEEATARALAFPLAGSPTEFNTRRVLLKSFPYSIIYRPEPDGVVCSRWRGVRLMGQRQDLRRVRPAAWPAERPAAYHRTARVRILVGVDLQELCL